MKEKANSDKRQQLTELMSPYVNEIGIIDITKFRAEHPTDYALLPHYFGTVKNAIEYCGWVKVNKTIGKHGEKITLRDQLAFHALRQLRKQYTLDQIGDMFGGSSRAAVGQLYKALECELNNVDELGNK